MYTKNLTALLCSALVATSLWANSSDAEGEEKLTLKANLIKKIEFSGTHYFGYSSINPNSATPTSGGFESRRNYIQMKSYFTDKDYFRVTLDARKELASGNDADKIDGYNTVYVKYAYLWLNDIAPYSGAEIGIAHRPWIDYEEHNGWYWRSINKVVLEDKHSSANRPDLLNSSDFGVNVKTKLPYFQSEIGLFNGEGYHADKTAAMQKNSTGLSFEGRLSYSVLGNGDKKVKAKKDSYFHISTAWMMSSNHKDDNVSANDPAEYDRQWNSLHMVYNQPAFLIAAQYIKSTDTYTNDGRAQDKVEGTIYSANADVRFGDYTVLARYDVTKWEKDGVEDKSKGGSLLIAGVAYDYMPGIKLIANIKQYRNDAASTSDYDAMMLTTAIHW